MMLGIELVSGAFPVCTLSPQLAIRSQIVPPVSRVEKYFTFTLRNKSFSLAVASLKCMKLFKAVFAAVNE